MTTRPIRQSPSTAADAEYLYRLTEQTMRAYVEATWGQWKAAIVRDFTADAAARGAFSILSVGGERVGALLVTRHASHIQLEQIYIAQPHQRRGIGTRLLGRLKAEARRSRKPLRLRVLRVNPARSLYERLGFRVTAATEERYFMEYRRPRHRPVRELLHCS